MRRLIICSAFIFISLTAFSQKIKLGIQFSPGISINRLQSESVDPYINTDGSKLKFRFGPIADFALTETYFFTTGILFATKSVSITYIDDINPNTQTEEFFLQYLQLPIALKLYTNEIMLDTRIYVSMGLMAEINIDEKQAKNYSSPLIADFSLFDTSLLLGVGIEYNIGTHTAIYGGFSYNRGLLNSIADYRVVRNDNNLKIHNDLINLDLGVKF